MQRQDPARALLHPLWWLALALLVVNDHVLKGAGALPAVVTGKLSDLAGLVVAPWILAALAGVTTRRGVLLAHGAVGAGFSLINVVPAAARWVEAVSTWTPIPWRITADPTDLLALPALALSFVYLSRGEARVARRSLSGVAFTAGMLACMATSPVDDGWRGDAWVEGQLWVVNDSGADIVVHVRRLRPEVTFECAFVAEDPAGRLSLDAFGPIEAWTVTPENVLALTSFDRACGVFLVGGEGLDDRLLFTTDEVIGTSLDEARADAERSVHITVDEEALAWGESQHLFPAPSRGGSSSDATCPGPRSAALTWSGSLPAGPGALVQVTSSPDGCHALDLDDGSRTYVCLDENPLPFGVGEVITISEPPLAADGTRSLLVESEAFELRVVIGSSPAHEAFTTRAREGCAGSFDECGSLWRPLDVVVTEAGGEQIAVAAGEPRFLSGGVLFYVASAGELPVRDTLCTPTPLHIESFSLRPRE